MDFMNLAMDKNIKNEAERKSGSASNFLTTLLIQEKDFTSSRTQLHVYPRD